MNELLKQVQENAGFLLVCILITAALSITSHLAENKLPGKRAVSPARRVSIIGICAAIAVVLHVLDFPILLIAPSFYKLDFSELPVMLGAFFLGPSAAVAIEGIKILLKLLLKGTSTAFVGDFANFVVGCSFALPAAIWYQANKSKHSALVGLILGTASMTVLGSAFNAFYLLPKFAQLFHMPLDAIIGMGSAIHSSINSVSTFVLLCVAPLNLLKGAVISALTVVLYKRVARTVFRYKE